MMSWSPGHIDDELVARTEDIVLRRGDVHLGLEGERLVVEDVTAEDALAHRGRLPLDKLGGIGTLMGDYLIIGHLIIDTHAILGVTNGIIDIAVETAVGDLLGILTAQALDLLHRSTTLDQTRGNLRFRGTRLLGGYCLLEDLTVGHALTDGWTHQAEG